MLCRAAADRGLQVSQEVSVSWVASRVLTNPQVSDLAA
jgi:hypothetical protein